MRGWAMASLLFGWLLLVGCNYETGRLADASGDRERAVAIWTNAAEWGDVDAQLALARLYLNGEGVPQDLDRAKRFAQTAVRDGEAEQRKWAYQLLAEADERQGREQDAFSWYARAAGLGNPWAQSKLAGYYLAGAPRDQTRAARLYHLAAEAGNPYAQTALGDLYARGTGSERGRQYAEGPSAEPDLDEAAKWYGKAADQGNPGH